MTHCYKALSYLLVHMPYANSTNAKLRFNIKNRNKFLEFLSENINLKKMKIISLTESMFSTALFGYKCDLRIA